MRIVEQSRAAWDPSSSLALATIQWFAECPPTDTTVNKSVNPDDAVAILNNLFQEVETTLPYLTPNHERERDAVGDQLADQLLREDVSLDKYVQQLENKIQQKKNSCQKAAESVEAKSRRVEDCCRRVDACCRRPADRLNGKAKPDEIKNIPSVVLRTKSSVVCPSERISWIENTPPVGSSAIDVVSRRKPVPFDQEFKRQRSRRYQLGQSLKRLSAVMNA